MNTPAITSELNTLFEQRKFQQILDKAQHDEISPASDPTCGMVVAAALFQLGRYSDCMLWCESLFPAMQGDTSFSSMYGAVLRRLGKLQEAEKIFREALEKEPNNPFLRNNFANLLIDMQYFDESEQILQELLSNDPSYEDAQVNLNRLYFQKSLSTTNSKTANNAIENNIVHPDRDVEDAFRDPLIAAFSDEEVAMAGGVNQSPITQNPEDVHNKSLTNLPNRAISEELQETLALARQTIDSDPKQVIKDCILLHNRLGIQAPIYAVAGEAYIRLQLFGDAETALLIANALDNKEASVLLNLANLAVMRGDQRLALHWLQQVAQQQPDHPQIEKVTKTLFPNGSPKLSTAPFQVNTDQRSPGHFS